MLHSLINTIKLIPSCFVIGDNYILFLRKNKRQVFYYVFFLSLLSIFFPLKNFYLPNIEMELEELRSNVNEQFPNFTINQYGITIENNKTFVYTNVISSQRKNLTSKIILILDKENLFTRDDLVDFEHLIYFNDTDFLLKRGNIPPIEKKLKDLVSLNTITKKDVEVSIGTIKRVMIGVVAILLLFYNLINHFLYAGVATFFLTIFPFLQVNLSFFEVFKLAIYSFTTVVVLKSVLLFLSIPLPFWVEIFYFLLGVRYLFTAMRKQHQL